MFDTDDTIAAITTPLGESGIGVIRISGKEAYAVGDKIFSGLTDMPLSKRPDRTIQYGRIKDEHGHCIDEVLAMIMRGPRSYTAEDVLEIQCHGGRQSLQEILALILRSGARLANPGEFTQRAFVHGRIDLAQAEAVMDVIQAKSSAGLTSAVEQLEGRLSRLVSEMRLHLTELVTRLEVTIDYPEEDLEDVAVPDIAGSLRDIQDRLNKMLDEARSGKMIRDGVVVAIAGTPNAGKSSLLNQLAQEERAIVTDVPGTTRDSIDVWITIKGIPVCLVDTAGIRDTADAVEQIGVNRARQYMEKADIILVVIDGSRPLLPEDRAIIDAAKQKNAFIVLNKQDLPISVSQQKLEAEYGCKVVPLSATKGEGLDELKEAILATVMEKGFLNGDNAILTNTRHIELIRQSKLALEQALQTIEEGMPVDCAIVDMRRAWELLGSITGDTVSDDIVTEIFSRFCLGK